MSKEKKKLSVVKVIDVSREPGQPEKTGGSKQMPADPFSSMYSEKGLVQPLYDMENLLMLREINPIHDACIQAKASDIAGRGYDFSAVEGEINRGKGKKKQVKEDEQLRKLKAFCSRPNPEYSLMELLKALWSDYEGIGWGALEVVPNGKGEPSELHHVPGHTLRAHRDGIRFAQYLEGKYRWFKRFGAPGNFDLHTGEPIGDMVSSSETAGEIIVLRKPNSRSSFYGVPDFISALGTLRGSQAVRDYNIDFFSGRTIPDALLLVEGVDEVEPKVEQELKAFFSAEVKGEHHKLAILPLPGEATAKLEKITPDIKEASFRLYRHDNAIEICTIHRVPPYRIGWPITGSLGGNSAKEMDEMYKRSVVEPGQEVLEYRLNEQLFRAFLPRGKDGEPQGELKWRWELDDLDGEDALTELKYNTEAVQNGLLSPNEGRENMGYETYPGGDVYIVPANTRIIGGADREEVEETPGATPNEQNGGKLHPNTPPAPNPLPGDGKGQEPPKDAGEILKAISDDARWVNFVSQQQAREAILQEKVIDFFGPRGNG
jgi:PBSX family phage portal protein